MDKNKKKTVLMILWLCLAVLYIGYGFVVLSVGSGTGFFAVWMAMGVVFVFFAIAVKMGLWKKLPGLLRKIFVALVCVGLVIFCAIEGCIISGFDEHGEKDLDYIIVLGAQVKKSGPSVALRYRLDEATRYLEENPDTVCIVSGGQGYNEPYAEAVGMAAYLEEKGIPEERIILETESRTTDENIRNSMEYMDEDASVGVVTNNFHVFRAVQIAHNAGLADACGIAAGSPRNYLPNNMFREFFGVTKYLVFHR